MVRFPQLVRQTLAFQCPECGNKRLRLDGECDGYSGVCTLCGCVVTWNYARRFRHLSAVLGTTLGMDSYE